MFVATIQPLKFQSTLPRGERRHEVQQQTQVRDFNPRSHEGSDCGKGLQRSTTLLFQSTLPRGERLPIPQRQSERILFQSTLPRGERRSRSVYSLCHYAISIHAPTRGATTKDSIKRSSNIFQSTLPRGERLWKSGHVGVYIDFNPRSHEGSDKVKTAATSTSEYFNPRSHEGSDRELYGCSEGR